jgi:signal transduction histidine kinase
MTGNLAGQGGPEPGGRPHQGHAGGGRQPGAPPGPAGAPRRLLSPADEIASRWPLGRIIGVGMLILAVVLIASIVTAALSLSSLDRGRNQVVNTLDPAAFHGSQLYAALLNQETGLRGYVLSGGQQSFLQPYKLGLADQKTETARLDQLLTNFPDARKDLSTVLGEVASWRSAYAVPVIRQVASTGKPPANPDFAVGKADFDQVRAPLAQLQASLSARRQQAVASLNDSAGVLDFTGLASALVLLLVVLAIGIALRAAAIRPITRLAGDARRVAEGDFDHEVDPSGPREVHTLAVDVNRMRRRILQELSAIRTANVALESRALDLERSNAELEQFAYVASHDLQEPLRKVASFCQLLQRRYVGQLDARADQYIEFAVDGAKRMQSLIDDLLTFSRVGRSDRQAVAVSAASALSQARVNLAAEIRRTGAVIETTELPVVRAEFSLLTSLFQNLTGNALKFAGQQAPVIRVSAVQRDVLWEFSVTDNGIGIEPEFADRIFVIFQRLHDRATYEGTGIGLAMCRKIVEHYGGTIWLDTSYTDGARFCFTLPVTAPEEEKPDEVA